MKVCANIVCKNEAFWIEESIRSILPFVDEVVVIDDQSDDDTLDKAYSIDSGKIKIFPHQMHSLRNLGDLKNFAIDKTESNLILRWDADFIAYPEIDFALEYVKGKCTDFDAYQMTGPNLAGTINYCPTEKPRFGPEIYASKKEYIKFAATDRYSDMPVHPNGTRILRDNILKNGNYILHANTLKPIEKLAMRLRMSEWNRSRTDLNYWSWLGTLIGKDAETAKEQQIKRILTTPVSITPYSNFDLPKLPATIDKEIFKETFKIKELPAGTFLDYPIYIK